MKKWEKMIQGDSLDYNQLAFAASHIKGVEGLVVEVGTRLGGGIKTIMESCLANDDRRYFLGIDPYGDIMYTHGERCYNANSQKERCDYNDNMMSSFLSEIYSFCYHNNLYYQHFILEDTEFMKRFEDGVVIYNMEKMLINKYALVHIDGPHNLDSVISESEFFIPRMSKDGFIIYDDVLDYDHDKVHEMLMERGFDLIQNGNRKLTYKKK
jgi:hypothetical protein